MTAFAYRGEVELVAARHGLAPDLVQAVCLKESSGNPDAWNPEPKYQYFWDVARRAPFRPVTAAELAAKAPPADFRALAGDRDQEWWAQQASWGLMQVMGAVAREQGFVDGWLTALLRPVIGLEFGCRTLAARLRWARGDTRAALAAYNGGTVGNAPGVALRNGTYADDVLRVLADLTMGTRRA